MTVKGVNPQAVIEAIQERARRGEVAGSSTDGRKLGLVIEGGGMRGVISASALLALEALHMTRVFDAVYGTSSGAVNGAYFLAGQAAYGTTIYYQDICNARFINPIRLTKMVDIDYLFERVIAHAKPLDVQRVLASPSQLFIGITDVHAAKGVVLQAQCSPVPLLTLLKASTALPVIYNRMVPVDGRPCIDGGVINHIPLQEAIADGCTDLLVLFTRPSNFVQMIPNLLERCLFKWVCASQSPRLYKEFMQAHNQTNAMRRLALGSHRIAANVRIATICPDECDPKVERTTKNGARIKAAAMANAQRTLQVFNSSCRRIVEVLRPFPT